MPTFGAPTFYASGNSGVSAVIGYESNRNRVVRFSFTTGSVGATSITIATAANTITNESGAAFTSIPFYITTSSTSHANANLADGYSVTGYITGSSGNVYSGTASVVLKANTTYYVWFFPPNKTYGWSYWADTQNGWAYGSTSYTATGTAKLTLSISAGTGSSITVNRTSSSVGLATGNLSNGAVIYKNDKLKISFAANTNYALATHTVNGSTFTSGNTHTVSSNVSVVSTATVLASAVGATNANIGSTSTITVTKYNSSYYHSLQYSFGSLSGYIKADGTTSTSEVKFTNASVAFSVPTTFYAQIPSAKTGTCTITCRTYSSSTSTTVLGTAKTCTFTATASESACKPTVNGTVVDTGTVTTALTGDSSKLIRYKSTAQCTISATANNSATISSKSINNSTPTNDVKTFTGVSEQSFVFKATDSRGYTGSKTISPTIIPYVVLTNNPIISRPSPTSTTLQLSISGDYYRGSFGAVSNTLKLWYRYREVGTSAWSNWTTISTSNLSYGSNSYYTSSPIAISGTYDYQKAYEFQVIAQDGTVVVNGETKVLTSVQKTVNVPRGIPVFDWGANDVTFNVPIKIGNTTLTEAQLQQLLALLN